MSKKLVGGDYLLDLSSIEIEQSEDGETYTNITNADVLEQLTNLKKYVPNPQMAKPVWIKLKNGENDELVVARGTFANVGTGEFEICVQLNGYKLIISIEFTQALNEDEQPIDDWYIAENDAKYLFTSDAQNINALVNADKIDNAKPIYCHPIYCTFNRIREGNSVLMTFTCLIFNNDATPFTADTFFDWVKALFTAHPNASIMASGYVEGNPISRIQDGIGSNLQLQVPRIESGSYVNQFWNFIKTDLTLETSVFIDGVNKIN